VTLPKRPLVLFPAGETDGEPPPPSFLLSRRSLALARWVGALSFRSEQPSTLLAVASRPVVSLCRGPVFSLPLSSRFRTPRVWVPIPNIVSFFLSGTPRDRFLTEIPPGTRRPSLRPQIVSYFEESPSPPQGSGAHPPQFRRVHPFPLNIAVPPPHRRVPPSPPSRTISNLYLSVALKSPHRLLPPHSDFVVSWAPLSTKLS